MYKRLSNLSSQMMCAVQYKQILVQPLGKNVHIRLNSPKTLNALSLPMIAEIREALKTDAPAVILSGEGGKAFCAGGDVKSLYFAKTSPSEQYPQELLKTFFWNEYKLDFQLASLPNTLIAVMDGIVMGGGVGMSINAPIRIATEKSMFAMPEAKLGLFTDVGGGYFLSRLHHHLGPFLGLTGFRLRGADLVHAGVADYYIETKNLEILYQKLSLVQDRDITQFRQVVKQLQSELPQFSLSSDLEEISKVFGQPTLKQIRQALASSKLAQHQKAIDSSCPISLAVIFEQIKRGKHLNVKENLEMDYRIVTRFMEGTDFFEGVKQVLVDKNHIPQWSLTGDIDQVEVEKYFANLGPRELLL